MIRIGINGFGRIGRIVFRAAMLRDDVKVVAINDLFPADYLAYLLRHDSVHGPFKHDVDFAKDELIVDGDGVRVSAERDPANITWGAVGVDVVADATGIFLRSDDASGHISAGASKVIMCAPSKDETPMYVCGVNTDSYDGEAIVSNASCTTNCLAPLAKVLNDSFGLRRGLMTTVHSVTASQKAVDGGSMKNWRLSRSLLDNIIPSSTGAAKAVGRVLPELDGKLTGTAFRVPVSDVSVVDLTCELERGATQEQICDAMRRASEGSLKGILKYVDDDVVSSDMRGEECSSIFDARAGIQLDDTFIKVVSWYDNEWGYSCRVLDLATHVLSPPAGLSR